MQQSSMNIFCDECGAANEPEAQSCVACQYPLVSVPSKQSETSVAPIIVTPPVVREVIAAAPQAPASSVLPIDFFPGMVLLGRYQIRREIGRGGFSIVYLAEDLLAKRKLVAIKRIYLRSLSPRQMIDATETCNREIKILSHLKSVNGVPTFYEGFTDSENWYLILEYIEGHTLEEYVPQTPNGYLSENEAVEIGQQLASLLQKIHERNIIFRDVKPANIMLTPHGKLYLIDFGIARFFTPGQKKDTTPLGSPGYASPEQYGQAQTDARADVYGLGATLQTLLTGRNPLEASQGEPSRNPEQPSPRICRLLDEMLALERDRRPSRMIQVEWRLFRSTVSNTGNRWRPLFSICVGAGFSTLMSLGIFFFLQYLISLMPILFLIIMALGVLPIATLSEGRTHPWERSLKRLFWGANRYIDGFFVWLSLICVCAIVFIIELLLLLFRIF